jgi:hypothetical protein
MQYHWKKQLMRPENSIDATVEWLVECHPSNTWQTTFFPSGFLGHLANETSLPIFSDNW